MVVTEFVGCILKGLASEKPTFSTTYKDFLYYCTDTGDLYNGGTSSWNQLQGPTKAETLQNKILDLSTSTISHVISDPFVMSKRQGWINPSITAAGSLRGVFKGIPVNTGTSATYSYPFDATDGYISRFTSTVIENLGYFTSSSPLITRREYATYFIIRFRTNSTTNTRIYAGFSSGTTLATSDTPLGTTEHGILVGINTANANFAIIRNDGTGAATTSNYGIAKDTTWHNFEIQFSDTNVVCKLDGANTQTFTTKIPGLTTDLNFYIQFQNVTATSKQFDISKAFFESDII